LAPSGQFVADGEPAVLAIGGGRVVTATSQDGVRVIDLRLGVITARLITVPGIRRLSASDDGERLLATSGFGIAVWDTLGLASTPAQPAAGSSRGPKATGPAVTIDGGSDGTVAIKPSEGDTVRLPAFNSGVTASAIDPAGRNAVVGSDRGEVAEIDLTHAVVTRRWTAPNRAVIASVGWAGSPDTLAVQTADGTWWSPSACDDCGADGSLLAALKRRLRGCYREDNVANITAPVRAALGIRVCVNSPRPKVA
jgi:hypothetical protein